MVWGDKRGRVTGFGKQNILNPGIYSLNYNFLINVNVCFTETYGIPFVFILVNTDLVSSV